MTNLTIFHEEKDKIHPRHLIDSLFCITKKCVHIILHYLVIHKYVTLMDVQTTPFLSVRYIVDGFKNAVSYYT